MKRLLCLFVLLLVIGSQAALAAGPAPCIFQSLWTLCLTRNIRVGNNSATTGMITNPTEVEAGSGYYRDNSNAALASATQTGYTSVLIDRVSSSGGTAFQLTTNYQDAQTVNTALTTTNAKSAMTVTGDGTMSVGTGIKLPTTGGTAALLAYYEEFTQSLSFTGPRSISVTARFVVVGKTVTMNMPASVGATCTAVASFGIPVGTLATQYRPNGSLSTVLVPLQNNGADIAAPGQVSITSDGRVLIGKDNAGGTFTNGANCGWYAFSTSWTTN